MIELERVKKHLNIDSTFTEDDEYLLLLVLVAEDAISKNLDIAFEDLLIDGELPPAITLAALLLVGNLYSNREPISYTTVNKVPYTFEYLIGLYKNYLNC